MGVIVTGSSGFIGQRLCRLLEIENRETTKVIRTDPDKFSSDLICDLEFETLDQGAMLGFETIFHLAGLSMKFVPKKIWINI